mgnify:CR=1 FL=1|jgi:hypothetical protein|tara:strand:+ start:1528 stop:1875 length:348 start_codon:yes stop_codon:yes gene_type:complete
MKKSELKSSIKEEIFNILEDEGTVTTDDDVKAAELAKKGIDVKLTEEDDDEPTKAQLKGASKDSISTIAVKLQQITKEMKSTVNKWKSSEGDEKQKLRDKLLKLTNIKKELESML